MVSSVNGSLLQLVRAGLTVERPESRSTLVLAAPLRLFAGPPIKIWQCSQDVGAISWCNSHAKMQSWAMHSSGFNVFSNDGRDPYRSLKSFPKIVSILNYVQSQLR